jgi:ferrochelatase
VAAVAERPEAHLLFVTHSVPESMNDGSGPHGGAYLAQHRNAAAYVAERVAAVTGREHASDLVFCSRSGPPQVPWLEPDVNDHLEKLAGGGARSVVLVPIGFVSDHMEVVYDLDTEAKAVAAELGLPLERAATAGTHPRFVQMVRELMDEPEPVPCALTCCPPPRRRPRS